MEYFDLGNRENGTFMIRPNVKLHSFEVVCEFTESQGQVSTERVLRRNKTENVEWREYDRSAEAWQRYHNYQNEKLK